jgi:cyclohexa-1,5-dienecarbonyl-CoA hydratase
MPDGSVSLTVDGPIATITFSRPPVNALDRATITAMEAKFREVARRREIKLVCLAGRGEDFCLGSEVGQQVPEAVEGLVQAFHSLIRLLLTADVPTAALVQGRALGSGAELALACDFVFAETTAAFGFPEIHKGSFAPVAVVLLERRVGRTKAADLILCGAAMTAEAAERRGLINALVNPGDLVEAMDTMSTRLGSLSASSLRLAKRALNQGAAGDVLSALSAVERTYLRELCKTEDAREGIAATLEGREPVWKDR